MDIRIRPVDDADYDAIAAIYADESVLEQTSQIPYRTAAFWRGFYASKGTGTIELVAECDGKAVGHLGILLNQSPRHKHVGSFGIAVHRAFQGRGVGTALMQELVRLSDDWLNLLKLELDVFSDNEIAVALYKKFGFVIEGELKYASFKQGTYAHLYKMARFHPRHSF